MSPKLFSNVAGAVPVSHCHIPSSDSWCNTAFLHVLFDGAPRAVSSFTQYSNIPISFLIVHLSRFESSPREGNLVSVGGTVAPTPGTFCPEPPHDHGEECGLDFVIAAALGEASSPLPVFNGITCPECSCVATPLLYHVLQPSSWSTWVKGDKAVIECQTHEPARTQDISLVRSLLLNLHPF